jgi:hypothetical protein
MTDLPWHVAINTPYERLTDDLTASTAYGMEAIFSGYAGPRFSLIGQIPESIFEWWQAMLNHDPDAIVITFSNEAEAQEFASVSGGQLMG